ncbi:hypothetical protein H2203_008799 [Taxawa tesnikishii (nom. ined.)]|nr:hypothetical protein H2203_008799 [Dothideales sp. JES 119]
MSHPQPPTRQPTETETNQYRKVVHNVAIGVVVTCPILALLPPRKFDTYTIGLLGLTLFSANHLYREQSGKSILQTIRPSNLLKASAGAENLPTERAREFQRQLKEQREAQLRQEGRPVPPLAEEKQGVLEQVWMGKEKEGWQVKREKEVQEAMAQGKGYGDIIMDQIWEVWNWGKKSDEPEPASTLPRGDSGASKTK